MYQRMKCSDCGQNWADKGNEKNCKCPCHAPTPDVAFREDAGLYVWNFRAGKMVPIADHNVIEAFAKK